MVESWGNRLVVGVAAAVVGVVAVAAGVEAVAVGISECLASWASYEGMARQMAVPGAEAHEGGNAREQMGRGLGYGGRQGM